MPTLLKVIWHSLNFCFWAVAVGFVLLGLLVLASLEWLIRSFGKVCRNAIL